MDCGKRKKRINFSDENDLEFIDEVFVNHYYLDIKSFGIDRYFNRTLTMKLEEELDEHINEEYDLVNCSFKNIKEINNLPSDLKLLNCSYNNIQKLDNLPIGLMWLNCEFNDLISLDNLPESLRILYCSGNKKIKSLDNLPRGLKYLFCENCDIRSLNNLPQGLIYLKCNFNKIAKFENKPKELINIIDKRTQFGRGLIFKAGKRNDL